ncbi:hypothetical protein O181_038431 [Austropuccinia psidii MF-1]|uniref:Retrovirus-related Pol polyprotein from transposon TNT 1-94-like beta-barrel domain-containing protein n=1 Tax=Austropuccinia psidii MF-1 TaxID=1389203 RepID=A0A9Q3HBM7_9BASI|nr:hypothetical protein [Austropuccinia psidii MF-1]
MVNEETYTNSNLLWGKIVHQYASNNVVNRGRVCIEWQRFLFDRKLKNYIDCCGKMTMELESVKINDPNNLLSFSILGKLGGDKELHQFFDNLTLNKELIRKPELIITRPKDYSNIHKDLNENSQENFEEFSMSINEPHEIFYYCKNGKHNYKCPNHQKEDFWAENPKLRPKKIKKKQGIINNATHFNEALALNTSLDQQPVHKHQLIVDCDATHHMLNRLTPFITKPNPSSISVMAGNMNTKLTVDGIGIVEIICNQQRLRLVNCLYISKLKCSLLSLLELFKKKTGSL